VKGVASDLAPWVGGPTETQSPAWWSPCRRATRDGDRKKASSALFLSGSRVSGAATTAFVFPTKRHTPPRAPRPARCKLVPLCSTASPHVTLCPKLAPPVPSVRP
jgi:hypothetical protein